MGGGEGEKQAPTSPAPPLAAAATCTRTATAARRRRPSRSTAGRGAVAARGPLAATTRARWSTSRTTACRRGGGRVRSDLPRPLLPPAFLPCRSTRRTSASLRRATRCPLSRRGGGRGEARISASPDAPPLPSSTAAPGVPRCGLRARLRVRAVRAPLRGGQQGPAPSRPSLPSPPQRRLPSAHA